MMTEAENMFNITAFKAKAYGMSVPEDVPDDAILVISGAAITQVVLADHTLAIRVEFADAVWRWTEGGPKN